MQLISELRRRNVFRVAAAYLVGAWLIIQVVETIFPAFGFGDGAVRTVTVILAIGLLPALVISWIYEITPEGLKLEKDVDRSRSITPRTARKLDRTIMVLLALALGYFAVDKFLLEPVRDNVRLEAATRAGRLEALVRSFGPKSIAVLPFVNMSADPDQDYFSDGIAEEILNLLARIPELRVISRTSAFSYRDRNVTVTEVAEDLNVAHVLEGSVRKDGDRARVTVQLIDARSDRHLWSQTYDRTLDNLFDIQEEIAREVASNLKITLIDRPFDAATVSPEAHNLLLQGRHISSRFTRDSFAQANTLYHEALELDPQYLDAWHALTINYSNQASEGFLDVEEGLTLAKEAAESALAIDPDYAPSVADLGWLAMRFENDLERAAQLIQRAIELEPTNDSALRSAGLLLQRLGRSEQAIRVAEYLVTRDPVNAVSNANLGVYRLYARQLDGAVDAYRTVLSLSPQFIGASYAIGLAMLCKGEFDEAHSSFEAEPDEEYRVKGRALVAYSLGRMAEYAEALTTLRENWGELWPTEVAQVLAWAGDKDAAFEWLRRDLEKSGGVGWAEAVRDPLYDNLRDDPRWTAMLTDMRLSPEQLDEIAFELRLPL